MLIRIAALALAGALGTLCRYGLQSALQAEDARFPVGTFTVNMVGCLLFGVVWSIAESRELIHPELRLVILTGFMGAFTTFSTFVFESHQLARAGDWVLLAVNVGGQLALGLLLFGLGVTIGKAI
jgi:CrcB protein